MKALKIVCSGYIVRYPLGGLCWHHFQYLIGLHRLGHKVTFFEHYGWDNSCYDPAQNVMTGDPAYGIEFLMRLFRQYGLETRWCYIAEDGKTFGLPRAELAEACAESDLYFNLSNINWIPELESCRRRILVDTDPVFTQIGAHGMGGSFSDYTARFTYGENVGQPGCDMPTAGMQWLPTRQPVVLDLWPVTPGSLDSHFTTVMNWSPLGDRYFEGKFYGQKDHEFQSLFSFPLQARVPMELAVKVPDDVRTRLTEGGWRIVNPKEVTRDPWVYQQYLRASRAEFSVAKHGYVVTRSGWFSERSAAYLASGRPVVIQDTGFTKWLPSGDGVIPFKNADEAAAGIGEVNRRYESHCGAARQIAEEYFDSGKVLPKLVDEAMQAVC